jgi:hypothetical protein
MIQQIMGATLVLLVYLCVVIVVFSPTIYVVWLYVVGRRVSRKTSGLRKLVLITLAMNTVVAYLLLKMAFDFFLTAKVEEWQASTRSTIHNAVMSQRKFFSSHGRYYPVGPVRGPYQDDHGLLVEKDVILQVIPRWDHDSQSETFHAYAAHVLAKLLLSASKDGKVNQPPADAEEAMRMKSKLFGSVK